MIDETELDALLKAELAPPKGPADMAFVGRVDRTIAVAERYRTARQALQRQLMSEVLAIAAIGACLAFLSRVPAVREAFTAAPGLTFTALAGSFLLWLLIIRGRTPRLA